LAAEGYLDICQQKFYSSVL